MLYLVTAFAFMMLGGVEALLMRTQLAEPDNTLLTPQVYNQVLTMHGTTMVFLVVMPLWAGFANYFVPLQIGARDMAFPRLNALSYWLYLAGGIVFYASVFFSRRRRRAGPRTRRSPPGPTSRATGPTRGSSSST